MVSIDLQWRPRHSASMDELMTPLDWMMIALLVAGGWMFISSFLSLRRLHLVTGGVRGVGGLLMLAMGLVLLLIGSNLRTYQALTAEQDVVHLHFVQLDDRLYQVRLRYPDGSSRSVDLRGDEWQVDARVFKWKGYATLLGLEPVYRLERISGRYHEAIESGAAGASVYTLAESRGLDIWALVQRYSLPLADSLYGSAVYLPMANNAEFSVRITQSGLLARPLNEPARGALSLW